MYNTIYAFVIADLNFWKNSKVHCYKICLLSL